MIAGMKSVCAVNDCSFMAFSGITAIQKAIEGLGSRAGGTGACSWNCWRAKAAASTARAPRDATAPLPSAAACCGRCRPPGR